MTSVLKSDSFTVSHLLRISITMRYVNYNGATIMGLL